MHVLRYDDTGYHPVELECMVLRSAPHLIMTRLIETLVAKGTLSIAEAKAVVGGDWTTVDELPGCWRQDFDWITDWLCAPTPADDLL